MSNSPRDLRYELLVAVELIRSDRLEEAEEVLQTVNRSFPKSADSWHLRGLIFLRRGDLPKAQRLIEKAIKLNPNDADFHSNLGVALKNQGLFERAISSFDRALAIAPGYAEALCNKGLALEYMGRFEQSVHCYEAAIAIKPDYAVAYSNRGVALQKLSRLDEAGLSFRQAIAIEPTNAQAHNNYAGILRRRRDYEAALRSYDRAAKLDSRLAEAVQGVGEVLGELGRNDEALLQFRKALAMRPGYAEARWAISFTLLAMGSFAEGWQLYEARFEQNDRACAVLRTRRPHWAPAVDTRRLLVWSEQGVGDEVFFASWLGQIERLAAQATIAVDARMLPIYRRSFPTLSFIDKATIPPDREYDCHLPIGSIPKSLLDLGLTPEPLRQVPFLQSDPERIATLRAALQRPNERLCGLTWRSTRPEIGAEKSIDLQALLPILRTPGLRFVSLQYGEQAAELQQLREQTGIEIVQHPEIDNFKDLEGHAALTRACDLIVSVCNATAHLAGAQGVPGYILAPRGKSLIWYWANRQNGHSLWYPTLELFEQTPSLKWEEPIQQVADRLASP